jgi:ribonuclease Z
MIDAGIGALRQVRRIPIEPVDIDILLITHWHFDHFLGLPALLRTEQRVHPLSIFAPEPSSSARLYLGGMLRSPYVSFKAINSGFSQDSGKLRITAVPTIHDINSFGWVITEIDPAGRTSRKLVYSGDTRPVPAILNASRGADLLIHEATFLDIHAGRARAREHTTPSQAAKLALEAGAGSLALTHTPVRNIASSALENARRIFPKIMVPSLLDKLFIQPVPDTEKTSKAGWGRVQLNLP